MTVSKHTHRRRGPLGLASPRTLDWSILWGSAFWLGGARAAGTPGLPQPTELGTEPNRLGERVLYAGREMVGLFSVCQSAAHEGLFLDADFFNTVRLKKLGEPLSCQGRLFYRPLAAVAPINPQGTLTLQPKQSDYDSTRVVEAEAPKPAAPTEPEQLTRATVLQHNASFWHDRSGLDLTLGLNARHFTEDSGLFVLDGYASSAGGRTQGFIANLGWRQHYPEQGLDARFGVNSLALSGNAVRSYGLMLGSDDQALQSNSTQSLEGFSEVPGKLVVRANSVIVKEVPISAGFFNVPLGPGTAVAGANGQYELSIVNDSGQVVRSWSVFVPAAAQLLRPGRANWQLFVGSVQGVNTAASRPLAGRFDLGLGGVYRYGLFDKMSVELSGYVAQRNQALGSSFVAVPYEFASLSGGFTKNLGDLATSSAYGTLDLHHGNIGSSLGYSRQSCGPQPSAGPLGGVSSSGGLYSLSCRQLRTSVYFNTARFGRITLLSQRALGDSPMGSSRGLSYTFPNLGRLSLSVFGTRQVYLGSNSYALGLQASLPMDGGQVMQSLSKGSSGSTTSSTTYSSASADGVQHALTADVTPGQPASTALRLNASVNRWDGSYQGNARLDGTGALTLGASESGALVFSHGQVLRSNVSDDSYAVLRLKGLPHVALEDGNGRTQGRTNAEGYAAVPIVARSEPRLRVNAAEVADNLLVAEPLVLKLSVGWRTSYREPEVRQVVKGWVRLMLTADQPVPLGSVFRLPGSETLIVLDQGDVFVPDLPARAHKVLVYLPGSAARCEAQFEAGLPLSPDYNRPKPQVACELPTAAAERQRDLERARDDDMARRLPSQPLAEATSARRLRRVITVQGPDGQPLPKGAVLSSSTGDYQAIAGHGGVFYVSAPAQGDWPRQVQWTDQATARPRVCTVHYGGLEGAQPSALATQHSRKPQAPLQCAASVRTLDTLAGLP
ncbi:MAG: hypothetical protein EKK45_04490 [Curvibacter sp.]|nr:MAG: hypothetical protein EKK45_04490 [Curvibacter sp.]